MAYAIVVFVFAVAIIVARVFFNMRKVKQANSTESWDEKVIAGLRQRGYAPFNAYPVDFFLALPDEAAVQGVRGRLETEGIPVFTKGEAEGPYRMGPVHLYVPAELEVQAVLVIDEIRSGRLAVSADDILLEEIDWAQAESEPDPERSPD